MVRRKNVPLIATYSDWGTERFHISEAHGILAQRGLSAPIIEVTNDITPFSILHASHLLLSSFRFFPRDTIHVSLVDPSPHRDRIVIIKTSHYVFVGADNGILWEAANADEILQCVEVSPSNSVSVAESLRGRDIMLPLVGKIAHGVPLETLGKRISPRSLTHFEIPLPTVKRGTIHATVLHIDRFGNIRLNLRSFPSRAVVQVKKRTIPIAYARPYNEKKGFFAYRGATGHIEIARANASANEVLTCAVGDVVHLRV